MINSFFSKFLYNDKINNIIKKILKPFPTLKIKLINFRTSILDFNIKKIKKPNNKTFFKDIKNEVEKRKKEYGRSS